MLAGRGLLSSKATRRGNGRVFNCESAEPDTTRWKDLAGAKSELAAGTAPLRAAYALSEREREERL
jgi:hypothetical protein